MAKHTFLAFSNPTQGKEKEYNDWYTNQHIPDVVSVPGMVAAQRFKMADFQMANETPLPGNYLTIYEIDTDDLKSVFDTMQERLGTGQVVMTDALDISSMRGFIYSPITDRMTTKEVARMRRKTT